MAKIISFYNHKGGVAKTTTIFNLAHLLAESGRKTLVVDADPQCNITEILLSPIIEQLDNELEKTGIENQLPGTTLLQLLKPRIDGEVPEIQLNTVEVVEVNEKLDLIRGDVSLNNVEDALAEAHIQRFSTKIHEKRTYVAIGDFLNRIGLEREYEYILIDVGPSSGALTRSCFLACDAFLIPTAPDRFNVQAIGTLSTILDRWLTEHNQVYEDFCRIGLPIKHGKPKFLGTTIQHFKLNNGRPKPGFKLWMDRIPHKIHNELFPVLRKHSTEEIDMTSALTEEEISVTHIPDFGSLAPLMQEVGRAVFQINREDTALITESEQPWGGGTWKDASIRINQFKERFIEIGKRLERI